MLTQYGIDEIVIQYKAFLTMFGPGSKEAERFKDQYLHEPELHQRLYAMDDRHRRTESRIEQKGITRWIAPALVMTIVVALLSMNL